MFSKATSAPSIYADIEPYLLIFPILSPLRPTLSIRRQSAGQVGDGVGVEAAGKRANTEHTTLGINTVSYVCSSITKSAAREMQQSGNGTRMRHGTSSLQYSPGLGLAWSLGLGWGSRITKLRVRRTNDKTKSRHTPLATLELTREARVASGSPVLRGGKRVPRTGGRHVAN